MAEYKVPQDVEADDKLLGPFSFRQFIYILIAIGGIALAWALSRIFILLAIVPLPIVLLFGALALPLRKDQPMETYLAALISFYIKPRKRVWDPDGQQSLIEITAPKTIEKQRTKGFGEDEAQRRLSYLAGLVDSRGWAVRGVVQPENTSMNSDVYYEAQQTVDVLDDEGSRAMSFDSKLSQADNERRQSLMSRMNHNTQQPTQHINPSSQTIQAPYQYNETANLQTQTPPQPQQIYQSNPNLQPAMPSEIEPEIDYNPYPAMRQSVVQPLSAKDQHHPEPPIIAEPAPAPKANPKPKPEIASQDLPSPDIINLVNNAENLTVETIAHEADRIKKRKEASEQEVMISLR